MIIPQPDFDITDEVYIDEILVCNKLGVTLSIKASQNFMQYKSLLYEIIMEAN